VKNLSRLILSFSIVFLLCSVVFAEYAIPYDGRAWRDMERLEKSSYLIGVIESGGLDEFAVDLSVGEVMSLLDKFYANEYNRSIPIMTAVKTVIERGQK
jgi:hypothetical protein